MTAEDKRQHRRARKAITNRERYLRKKEELLAYNRVYHVKNAESVRAQQRQYRLANLEARKQNCRDWYAAQKADPNFKERESARGCLDYQKHKAKRAAKHKEWLKRNPGYMAAVKHRRRLVENASKNLATIKAWVKSVKSKSTAICYYCQETLSTDGVHFDHIVPISKGGIHDVSNLCVSCAKCNLTKQDKHVSAWVRVGQQVLSL